MGDRFYGQQKNHKPTRVLKKDVIAELHTLLRKEVDGLDRLTIKTLNELIEVIKQNED
jgi:hypothetical protein